ncbi:MAG: DUF3365 domain-containing protein [Planctomycetales bacterium]|nr:DUF3365 domain-containing protein [Planctomycetales bacterium]
MTRNFKTIWLVLSISTALTLAAIRVGATPPGNPSKDSIVKPTAVEATSPPLPSVDEARGRARLLHETIRTALQVVHHEYYREDEKLPIPARTFQKVFQELADRQKIEVHWLAVNAQAMNQDHNPRNDFEKKAVGVISSGAEEYELVADGLYRHAGLITLTAECLKCHLPNRTSLKNRAAGLVIAMPIEKK